MSDAAVSTGKERFARRGFAMLAGYAVVVLLLVLLDLASVEVLSAVRAYVGGESLYSKAQKTSVQHLLRYLDSGDQADFERYQASIAIPIGDRIARLELERPDFDPAVARRGFLQGANHRDDIDAMVQLFRLFRRVPFMDAAITIWAEGDRDVAELDALALALHAERSGGALGAERRAQVRAQVLDLDARLDDLEQRFSATLGAGARETQRLLVASTLLLGALLAAMAIGFARRTWHRLALSRQALAESNRRWEMAAAAGDIGVVDWNLETDEVALDARAMRLYGLGAAAARLARERLRECLHPDDARPVQEAIGRALDEGRSVEYRYRVALPAGGWRTLELGARADGGRSHMVGFVRDVSNEVLAEQLRLERNAAARASAAKSEFLSRVSHELRTPLNAVIGFTQLLLSDRGEPPTPAQAARLRRVEQGGRYLLRLVEDLLDLTGIEQGTLQTRVEGVALVPLLESAIAMLEPARAARGVSIRLVAPVAVSVRADPMRLSQVFVNLLSNAIKYNRPQGEVTIDLRAGEREAVVSVADTGHGLGSEQVAQLFQPFNRLGAEYSGIDGSGLGLVICRRIVEALGGTLAFESDPPRGSCVTVRLPRPDAPAVQGDGLWGRILYIGDNPGNLLLMREYVAARPAVELDCAADGRSGLEAANAHPPDLVLLDLQLPDPSGLEVLRRLRAAPGGASLQIVVLSGSVGDEIVAQARAAGADDCWTRPLELSRLRTQLAQRLRREAVRA